MKIKSNHFQKQFDLQKAQLIGQGNFAQVFRVFDNELKDSIAIRKVKKSLTDIEDINKQILINDELRKVQNENILKIYDIIDQQEIVWYITQYCSGGSLWDALNLCKDNRMNQKQALQIILQVSKGIQQLHNHRITHRDLKPENILLKSKYVAGKSLPIIKLADFGLSTQKIIMQTIAGTKQYIAPQQAKFHNYTNAVDVWSLGIIFDQILHGSPFYSGTENKQVFNKILKIPYKVRDQSIRTSIKDLLISLLKKKPYERPIIAVIKATVQKILDQIQSEAPVSFTRSMNDKMKKSKQINVQLFKSSIKNDLKKQFNSILSDQQLNVVNDLQKQQKKNNQNDKQLQTSINQQLNIPVQYKHSKNKSAQLEQMIKIIPNSQINIIQKKQQKVKSTALIQPPNLLSRNKYARKQSLFDFILPVTPKNTSNNQQKKQKNVSYSKNIKQNNSIHKLSEQLKQNTKQIVQINKIQNQNNIQITINSQLKNSSSPTHINNKLIVYKNQKKKMNNNTVKKQELKKQFIDVQKYKQKIFNSKKQIQNINFKIQKKFNSFLPNIHLNTTQFQNIKPSTQQILQNFSKKHNVINYMNQTSQDYQIKLIKSNTKLQIQKQKSINQLCKIQQQIKNVFFQQLDKYIDQYIQKTLK